MEGKINVKIQVTGRGGRRPQRLLDELEESRGYCKLNEKALDRVVENLLCKRL